MEWNEGRNETMEGRKRGRKEGKTRGGRRDTEEGGPMSHLTNPMWPLKRLAGRMCS